MSSVEDFKQTWKEFRSRRGWKRVSWTSCCIYYCQYFPHIC